VKTHNVYILFVFFIIVFSCTKQSKYKGYKKLENNIYYKLFKTGEVEKYPNPGDYLTVDLIYKTMQDSIFFKGRRKIQLAASEFPGAIDECFPQLSIGDSAEFIIDANLFFNKTIGVNTPSFIKNSNNMKVDIQLLQIKSQAEFKQEKKEFLSWIKDFGEYEQVLLKHYIDKEQMDISPKNPQIFYKIIKKGNNKTVEIGDTVIINYEGRFLNGDYFDSTIKRKQAFEFVYGTQWQVIKGIEYALKQMHEGEKSIFIFPSYYAFGYNGSSSGIIPPFTSVVFEIKLEKIKKANKTKL